MSSIHCCKFVATFKKLCCTNDDSSPRSTDHRPQSKTIRSIYWNDDRDVYGIAVSYRVILQFSTAGKRIIITSVHGAPDNSTVIKGRLPPFVVYIFITNIRKVLPYCIVRTRYGNMRGRSYLLLLRFMRHNARIKFITRLRQSYGRYIF